MPVPQFPLPITMVNVLTWVNYRVTSRLNMFKHKKSHFQTPAPKRLQGLSSPFPAPKSANPRPSLWASADMSPAGPCTRDAFSLLTDPYTCGYCVQQAQAPFVCPEELWFLLHPCSHGSPAECVCGSPSLLPRVFASQCSHATCFYILNGIIITPFLVSHLC